MTTTGAGIGGGAADKERALRAVAFHRGEFQLEGSVDGNDEIRRIVPVGRTFAWVGLEVRAEGVYARNAR